MSDKTLKQKQQRQDKEKQAYTFYISKGWTPEQAIGIVGNLIRESNLNTTVVGTADDKGSQGIAQWHSGRLRTLKDRYGDKWTDFRNQLEFVDWELKNTEKAAGNKLKDSKGIWEAGRVVSDSYERPKIKFSGDVKRQRHVSDLAMKFKGIKLTPQDMPYYEASYANSVAPYLNQPQETVTPNINYFDIPKEITTFASVPDSAEEDKKETVDKDVEEVETKTKEYNFLEALQNLSKEDYAHLQSEQVAQQQIVPQVDFNQQFEQVSQFIDQPLAQSGGKYSENELTFLSEIGIPVSSNGLYDYPNQKVVVPTKDGRITMKNINYEVLGTDEYGNKKIMKPNGEYQYKGKTITEIPLFKK